MEKTTTSKRLLEIMRERNLKQVDILNLVDKNGDYISKSALSQYINGKSVPDQHKLTILSRALEVSEAWLMGYNVPMTYEGVDNIIFYKPSTKKVPLVGSISAGTPTLAVENIEDYIDLDSKIQADFALRIKGDSMINANIYDGDIVFIHKQPDVDDGQIAAVLVGEDATLKRVYKIGGVIQLRAENPMYEPITLNGDQNVIILGKATYKLSKVL